MRGNGFYMLFKNFEKETPELSQHLDYHSSYATIDIESKLDANNEWVFVIAAVAYRDRVEFFNDVFTCFDYLKKIAVPVYAHNLDFDLLFFMREPSIIDATKNTPIINSGNKIIAVKLDGVEFRNSLVLFPTSLLKVVKKFLLINDKDWEADKANVTTITGYQLKYYCAKDAVYLLAALNKYFNFCASNYGVKSKYTTPSMAFNIFINRFNSHKNLLVERNRHKFFDDGYYFGGHSEKFIAGQKVFRHCYYYDVNSLYPSVMRELEYNDGKLVGANPTISNIKLLVKKQKLFYCEVLLNINSEALRFFPVLDELKHINKYPLGVYWIKMSEIGINFVLKYGGWKNILECRTLLHYSTPQKIKPFEAYVDHFYSLRKAGTGFEELAKLMLNSLYGKFGEKPEKLCKHINPDEGLNYVSFTSVANTNSTIVTTKEPISKYKIKYNRLDIAGKITEAARLLMGDYINQARQYGKVIYTDTDSIITDFDLCKTPLSKLVDPNLLGALKNEEYNAAAIIIGVKMYYFYKSGKMARKGIKKMSVTEFRELIRGRKDFVNERFTKMYSLVDKGFFGIQFTPYEFNQILERLD